jgi:hypothetical protein
MDGLTTPLVSPIWTVFTVNLVIYRFHSQTGDLYRYNPRQDVWELLGQQTPTANG